MKRPYIVVVERRNYSSDDEYEEEIESWRANGYRCAFRVRSSLDMYSYTVLSNTEEV